MIALHKWNEGVPTHDTGGEEHFGPGDGVFEVQFAFYFRQIELDALGGEGVVSYVEGEVGCGGLKVWVGETMVDCFAFFAVEGLDEGVLVAVGVHGYAGDEGEGVFF